MAAFSRLPATGPAMIVSADTVRTVLAGCTLWAAAGLAFQFARFWHPPRDLSTPAGSGPRGLFYNLTAGLLPTRKESVRRHPVIFLAGLLLHIGVLLALVGVGMLLGGGPVAPYLRVVRPMLLAGLAAGVFLLARRIGLRTLRSLSIADDYIAIVAVCGFLAAAATAPLGPMARTAFELWSGLLLLYLPVGKLRHVVLFFVARAEYGWRLGRRGVYPPPRPRTG